MTRLGDWMQLASGRKFYPLDPRPEDLSIEVIALGLSKTCRFAGQCEGWYSVAEHSYHCSHLVPPEHALQALLHDATEAVMGDIVSPLKQGLPDYRKVEAGVWAAIAERFGVPVVLDPHVKAADALMLAREVQALMPDPVAWGIAKATRRPQLQQWPWRQARDSFLTRYRELAPEKVGP